MPISTQYISGNRFSVSIDRAGQTEQHEVSGRHAQEINQMEAEFFQRTNKLRTEVDIMRARLREAHKKGDTKSVKSFDALIQRTEAQIENLTESHYLDVKNVVYQSYMDKDSMGVDGNTEYVPVTETDFTPPTENDDGIDFQKEMMQRFVDMLLQQFQLQPQPPPTSTDMQNDMFLELLELVQGLSNQLNGDEGISESSENTQITKPPVKEEGEAVLVAENELSEPIPAGINEPPTSRPSYENSNPNRPVDMK